jgi:hypothetical protein
MKTVPPERIAIAEPDVKDEKDEDWIRCQLSLSSME